MSTYAGVFILPTQVVHPHGALAAIADAREKHSSALPPPQAVPYSLRTEFTSALRSVMELVTILEPHLHNIYLLVDRVKFEQIVGLIAFAQTQQRMCDEEDEEDPQYILTYANVVETLRILEDFMTTWTSIVAWTASEEGTKHRREINRVLAAMDASFNSWLDDTVAEDSEPEQALLLDSCTGCQDASSPVPHATQRPKAPSPHRPPPLNISARRFPDASSASHHEPETAPIILTPPPLSPLCRYRHATLRSCKYCSGIARRSPRSASRRTPYTYHPEPSSPRKRARWSLGDTFPDETLVCQGALDDEFEHAFLKPARASVERYSPPSSLSTLDPDSSTDRSTSSFRAMSSVSEPLRRPRFQRPRKRTTTYKSSRSKTPFLLRILTELFYLL